MVKMIFCLLFIEIFAVSENFDDGVPVYSFVETLRLREYVPGINFVKKIEVFSFQNIKRPII